MRFSEEQLAFWHANGYLVEPGVFPRDRCDELSERISGHVRAAAERAADAEPQDLDFWRTLARSRATLEVFWYFPDRRPTGDPKEWEQFATRVGHGPHNVDDRFRSICFSQPVVSGFKALIGPRADGADQRSDLEARG